MKISVLTVVFVLMTGMVAEPPMGDLLMTGMDPRQSCTIIYASNDKTALAGNNEDWTSPFGTIWFQPAEKGKYGRVYFGWRTHGRHIPQGGMNEQGLFWDGATAENVVVPPQPDKPRHDTNLIFKAMEECATVEEVIDLFGRYDTSGAWNGHYLVGDRFGHSAIIEPQTFIRKQGTYQIATNFFQSRTRPEQITDVRHRIAQELLDQTEELSVDLFRRVLNAVHWEEYSGSMTVTLYSYICDLKNGEIYVYHFHNFEDVVKINLREELKKGERFQSVLSLFPRQTFAARRYNAQRTVGLLYERAMEKGMTGEDGALAFFKELKRLDYKSYGLSVVEGHLLALAQMLLENSKTAEAVEALRCAVMEYPGSAAALDFLDAAYEEARGKELSIRNFRSAGAYDVLGAAFEQTGNEELAAKSCKKALELDPNNERAGKMLERLRKKGQARRL